MFKRKLSGGSATIIAIFCLCACSPQPKESTSPSFPKSVSTPSVPDGAGTSGTTAVLREKPRPSPASGQPESREPAVLAVDGEGLRLFNTTTTSASPIPFGRPKADVLNLFERLRGPAVKGTNQDCGAGPVEYATWPDGLSLVFQNDRFVGWGLDGRAAGVLSTASGVSPGSSRAQIEAAYAYIRVFKSTLGTEFEAGGFAGVLDGPRATSRIINMWGGTSCVAR